MPEKILSVGLICLDIVVTCNSFPQEDSDQRCSNIEWRRGGNASNNCTVFTHLNIPCEFLGNFSVDIPGKFLKDNILSRKIDIANCVYVENETCPTSCVLLNAENGTRTILHHRKTFPELKFEAFLKVNLSDYSWLHFEGRNVEEVLKMLEHATKWKADAKSSVPISVEIEKARPEKIQLLPYGDYVFLDKVFAQMCGFNSMVEAVQGVADKIKPGAIVICAWGEMGATARCSDGELVTSPSFPPNKLVDTLGAGDTFVAATIFALHQGLSVRDAITFGCQLAGTKCGIEGFCGLRKAYDANNFADIRLLDNVSR